MGIWFQLYRYENLIQRGCDCDFVNYTLTSDHSFTNTLCCSYTSNGLCSSGKASLTNPEQKPLEGKLITSFDACKCLTHF